MSRTGSEFGLTYPDTRYPKNGFTLVEVMITTAVLSLLAVMIHQAFFLLSDTFNASSYYMKVLPLVDEKVWEVQDALTGGSADIKSHDTFTKDSRQFEWSASCETLNESLTMALYRIDIALLWQERGRQRRVTRNAYALYKKKV